MSTVSDTSIKVSVVIPAYNMAEYVDEAIRSVLNGTFEDLEIITVDDGSTDDTRSTIKKYTDPTSSFYDPRVRYKYQTNRGKPAAVNRGFEMARGAYLTMLDADDELTPESLNVRYEARFDVNENPCDVIIGGFEVFDRSGIQGTRSAPEREDPQWLHDRFYLRWKTPFHLNACLFSSDLADWVGGLNESLHRCEDGDYALRLLREAETVQVVEDIVYRYRKHRSSWVERVKFRARNAWYRPEVIWKNYTGWRQWVGVPLGLILDTGKLFYELVDNYKK